MSEWQAVRRTDDGVQKPYGVLLVCTGPGALWAQATQGDAAGNLGATPSRSAIVL